MPSVTAMLKFSGLTFAGLFAGFGEKRVNASFAVTSEQARVAIAEMSRTPKAAARPIVILGGYGDIGLGIAILRMRLSPVLGSATFINVTLTTGKDFDDCRDRTIARVDQALGGGDADQTAEVDVIGQSMGGLVGRYAAANLPGRRRLNVHTLYTISSPHTGARMATLNPREAKAMAMTPGSAFLSALAANDAAATYTVVPYVRLGDEVVGVENAAPAGQSPWWTTSKPLSLVHAGAMWDERIVADIARRLRGETPFTTDPRLPVPADR